MIASTQITNTKNFHIHSYSNFKVVKFCVSTEKTIETAKK